jgi:ParB/RepB/Spo0J family partition protein
MKAGTESTADFEARLASRMLLNPLPRRNSISVADAVAMAANSSGPEANTVVELSLELIDTETQYQSRLSLDDTHIDALRQAFEAAGQTEPIQVRRKGDRYVVLRGHHRLEAAKRCAGWTTVKALVVDVGDSEALLRALTGNSGRLDETDFERALGLQRARELGIAETQIGLGRLFGMSQGRVSQILDYLKLPEQVLELLHRHPGLFSYRVAKQVRELCETYPQHLDIIIKGLLRIVDGEEEFTVRPWVLQSIQKLMAKEAEVAVGNTSKPAQPGPEVITTASGEVLCTVKSAGSKLIIDFIQADTEIPAKIKMIVRDAIKQFAQTME